MSLFDGFCLNLWIAGFEKARVAGLSEGVEAARMGFVVSTDGLDEAGIKSAGQVHHGMDVLPVHYRDNSLGSLRYVRSAARGTPLTSWAETVMWVWKSMTGYRDRSTRVSWTFSMLLGS